MLKEHYELLGFPEKGSTEFRDFKRLDDDLVGKRDESEYSSQVLHGLKYSIKELRQFIKEAGLTIDKEYFIVQFNPSFAIEYVAVYSSMQERFQEEHIKPFSGPDNYLTAQIL